MALFRNHWGYDVWVDQDDMIDGLEALELEHREVWEVAEDGDLPTGRDPLEILLTLEALDG